MVRIASNKQKRLLVLLAALTLLAGAAAISYYLLRGPKEAENIVLSPQERRALRIAYLHQQNLKKETAANKEALDQWESQIAARAANCQRIKQKAVALGIRRSSAPAFHRRAGMAMATDAARQLGSKDAVDKFLKVLDCSLIYEEARSKYVAQQMRTPQAKAYAARRLDAFRRYKGQVCGYFIAPRKSPEETLRFAERAVKRGYEAAYKQTTPGVVSERMRRITASQNATRVAGLYLGDKRYVRYFVSRCLTYTGHRQLAALIARNKPFVFRNQVVVPLGVNKPLVLTAKVRRNIVAAAIQEYGAKQGEAFDRQVGVAKPPPPTLTDSGF